MDLEVQDKDWLSIASCPFPNDDPVAFLCSQLTREILSKQAPKDNFANLIISAPPDERRQWTANLGLCDLRKIHKPASLCNSLQEGSSERHTNSISVTDMQTPSQPCGKIPCTICLHSFL